MCPGASLRPGCGGTWTLDLRDRELWTSPFLIVEESGRGGVFGGSARTQQAVDGLGALAGTGEEARGET